MTSRSHELIPRLRYTGCASDWHPGWSYEKLADLRQAVVKVRNSDFPWTHEKTHLEEIIDRIDATISLKRQRDEYRASQRKHGALWVISRR